MYTNIHQRYVFLKRIINIRKILMKYGLIERLCIDHGAEFLPSIFMHKCMWLNMDNSIDENLVYRQMKSTKVRSYVRKFGVLKHILHSAHLHTE